MRSPRQAGLLLAVLLSSAALAGTPSARAAGSMVRGRVLDDAGRPARGAMVELAPLRTHYDAALAAWRGEPDPAAAARGRTDELGAFSLQAPEPGFWKVVVSADGFVPAELPLEPLLEDVHLSDLLLVPDRGIEIRVLVPAGDGASPAGGVRSEPSGGAARPEPNASPAGPGPAQPEGSDSPVAATAWVEVASARSRRSEPYVAGAWRAVRRIARTVAPVDRVRLPRAAGEAVEVRVALSRGVAPPAAGSAVAAAEHGGVASAAAEDAPVATAQHGGVAAPAAAGAPAAHRVAIGRASSTGAATTVEVGAAAGRAVVRVTEESGPAIAGALVCAADLGMPLGMTDGEGRAEIAASASERLELVVLTPDGRGRWFTVRPEERRGGVAVLAMRRAERLAGSVVDDVDASPLAGAWVWANLRWRGSGPSGLPDAMLGELGVVARAEAGGRFALTVIAGTQVRAAAAGYGGANVLERAFGGFDFPGPIESTVPSGPTVVRLRRSRWIAGTVVDAGGQPVTAALVVPYAGLGQATNQQRSITDPQGRFRIAGWEGAKIVALAAGYAPTVQTVELGKAPFLDDLRLVLRRGRVARGRVMDLDQRPVAGARVRLVETRAGGGGFFPPMRSIRGSPPLLTATRADGGFEIAGVAGGFYDVTVDAAGYAITAVPGLEIAAGDGDADLGVLLVGPGVAIEGLVTDGDESPLPGVTVQARRQGSFERIVAPPGPEPWSAWLTSEQRGAATVETDAAGRFALHDLNPSEKVDLMAALEGYVPARAPGVAGPTVQPVVLVLERAAVVRGQVVDEEGGAVARPRVNASGATSSPGAATQGDAEGRFELGPLGPGSWRLEAMAPGYDPGESVAVELEDGEVEEGVRVILREQEHGEVEGRVVDEDGAAFPGAMVTCGSAGRARTGSGGEFRFERVPLGRQQIWAAASSGGRAVEMIEVREGVNTVELRLERGVEVSGRVVDREGGAVPGASVTLRSGRSPASRAAMEALGIFGMGTRITATDAAGAFVLVGVREGAYELTAEVAGRSRARLPGELRVADSPIAGLELVLEQGGVIRGALQGLDFDQLSQVALSARSETGFGQGRVVGAEYEIANLDAGAWLVTGEVRAHGLHASGRVTLEPGVEARLDLDFEAGITLSGAVTRRGQPAAGSMISLRGLDVAVQRGATVDFEGRYLLRGLEEGVYEVRVSSAPSGGGTRAPWLRRIELREDTELAIELGGGRVAGVVVDADSGDPIPGATVRLRATASAGDLYFADARRTGAAGEFVYEDVPEGSFAVQAVAEGYANEDTQIDLRSGAEVDGVVLELERSSGLVLRVTGAFGFPGSIEAMIVDRGGRPISARMRLSPGVNQGMFEVPGVGEGAWGVLVGSPGLATVRLDVQVPGPPVDVFLPQAARLAVEIPELLGTSAVAELEVLDALGRPFLALSYRGSQGTTWRMESGRVFVEALPPGQWTLRARNLEGAVWTGVASTLAGAMSQARLQ
jgi:protocatechuate 3,4-dioxygenase beta subunit